MTLSDGAEQFAQDYGIDDLDRQRLRNAYRAGYLQAITNWMNKARD